MPLGDGSQQSGVIQNALRERRSHRKRGRWEVVMVGTVWGFVSRAACFENSLQRALSRVGCVSRSLCTERVHPELFPFISELNEKQKSKNYFKRQKSPINWQKKKNSSSLGIKVFVEILHTVLTLFHRRQSWFVHQLLPFFFVCVCVFNSRHLCVVDVCVDMLSRNLEMYANSAAVATTNVSMLRGDTDSNKPLTNVAERPLPGRSFLFIFFRSPFFVLARKKKWEFDGSLS